MRNALREPTRARRLSRARVQAQGQDVLLDVSVIARIAGFTNSVAITRTVFNDCVDWNHDDSERQTIQRATARLLRLLDSASLELKRLGFTDEMLAGENRGDEVACGNILFKFARIPRDGVSTEPNATTLELSVARDAIGERLVTVKMPDED